MNQKRRSFVALNFGVASLLLLIVFALIYLIGERYAGRIQVGEGVLIRLSDETKNALAKFDKEKIEVTSFYPNHHPDRFKMENLLRECAASHSSFQYRMADPDLSPKLAQEFQVDSYGLTVIQAKGKEVRFESVKESDLRNALRKFFIDSPKIIYFVEGHEEPKLDDESEKGYSAFLQRVKGARYEAREINLLEAGIPKDANLVILAGPHTDLSLEELKHLENYFSGGGKIILMLDPVLPGEGHELKSFLARFGADLGSDVVVDRLSGQLGLDQLIAMVSEYPKNTVLSDTQTAAFFPMARSVRKMNPIPANLTISELALTGTESWAEVNLNDLENGKTEYESGVDIQGPISLALQIKKRESTGEMIIIGDSDFLLNEHIHAAGNKLFMMRLLQSIFGERNVSAEPEQRRNVILFTPLEEAIFFLVSVVIVPLFFLIAAAFSFFLRRRFA